MNGDTAKINNINPIYREAVVIKRQEKITSIDPNCPNKRIVETTIEFDCIGCGRKFKTEKETQIHLITVHNCNYVRSTYILCVF